MRRFQVTMMVVAFVLTAYACSKTDKASFQTTEDQRKIARDNSLQLAKTWRTGNPKYAQWDMYARGDSTIANDCPQGDGWATMDLTEKGTNTAIKLKCSTYSAGIGCLEESDFKTKAYAKEDGTCNPNVPFPIPHISE